VIGPVVISDVDVRYQYLLVTAPLDELRRPAGVDFLRCLLSAFSAPFRSIRNIHSAAYALLDIFAAEAEGVAADLTSHEFRRIADCVERYIPDTCYGGKNGGSVQLFGQRHIFCGGARQCVAQLLYIVPQCWENRLTVCLVNGNLALGFHFGAEPWLRLDSRLVTLAQAGLIRCLGLDPESESAHIPIGDGDESFFASVEAEFAFPPPGVILRRTEAGVLE
jgi:hypothetical protein